MEQQSKQNNAPLTSPAQTSTQKSDIVWLTPTLGRFLGSFAAVIVSRRCTLSLSNNIVSLTKGNNTVFSTPTSNMTLRSVLANGGAFEINTGNRKYTLLTYRPFFEGLDDVTAKKAKDWVNALVEAGAQSA